MRNAGFGTGFGTARFRTARFGTAEFKIPNDAFVEQIHSLGVGAFMRDSRAGRGLADCWCVL